MYGPGASAPFVASPKVPDNQFFSIVNPWYWVDNQSSPPKDLLNYWDTALANFFKLGNTLSINVGSASAPNVYEGQCDAQGVYTLTNVADSSKHAPFAKPAPGFDSCSYVFGNKFPTGQSTAGDAGLLQDNIWEALNRGVGLDGVLSKPSAALAIDASPIGATQVGSGLAAWEATVKTTTPHGLKAGDVVMVSGVQAAGNTSFPHGYNGVFTVKRATRTTVTYFIAPQGTSAPSALPPSGGGTVRQVGQTTAFWNNFQNWYQPNHVSPGFPGFAQPYNTYSKFLHYSTLGGTDSRQTGTPIFINNQAYTFGEDENPDGPYAGPEVPPKFDGTIVQGDTVTLRLDPWGTAAASSLATVAGDFDGNGLTDIADLKSSGQWQVALTPLSGNPTTVNAGSPWSTKPTWNDFTVIRDTTSNRDVVIARATNTADGSWWKLALAGSTWTTTFVGSWGIPDQWVNVVPGDFDGDGKQDIAGRWLTTGEWWMLKDAAAAATVADYAAKNVKIGQWNPAATWSKVVAGNFTGDAGGKDTIAGLTGSQWWLLERTGGTSTNTLMTSTWSTAHAWVDYQVGNFAGAANRQQQIAARSTTSGAWYLLGKSGASYAISHMQAWNPAANWLNVVSGDFKGDGTTQIAGRNAATGAWTVLGKTGGTSASPTFANASFGGAWPTSSVWGRAFAGIYTQQSGTPKKSGILGRAESVTPSWYKAVSSGTAFASASAPGYPT